MGKGTLSANARRWRGDTAWKKSLLQEITIMRTELVHLVEQGNSVQAGIVVEKKPGTGCVDCSLP